MRFVQQVNPAAAINQGQFAAEALAPPGDCFTVFACFVADADVLIGAPARDVAIFTLSEDAIHQPGGTEQAVSVSLTNGGLCN